MPKATTKRFSYPYEPQMWQAVHRRSCDNHSGAHERMIDRYCAIMRTQVQFVESKLSRGEMIIIYERCKREHMLPLSGNKLDAMPQKVLQWPKCCQLCKQHNVNWEVLKGSLLSLNWLELLALADILECQAARDAGKDPTPEWEVPKGEPRQPRGRPKLDFEEICRTRG